MIKFHLLLGKSPLEIHQVMEQALQDFCPSYETVRRWVVAIRAGKEDLDDEPRTGRPVTATSPDVEEKVAAAVRQDRRLTTRQMSEMVGVSHNSVHKILTENLGKRKVCAKWVPHLLTDEQKTLRVNLCAAHLRRHRREGISFLERIVACDETWAHSWEPELKRQSASWCGPDSPRPQKARRAIADLKVMHITFFDRHGVLFDQAVPVGQRVDGDYYLSTLKKVRRAIRTKRPELHASGTILLQDNAGPHRKREVLESLESWNWETLPHPPYSPDLSPCDFFLFPRIKEPLRGQRFTTEDEVNEAFKASLTTVTKSGVRDGIDGLVHRWKKCLEVEGGILNKDIIKVIPGNSRSSQLFVKEVRTQYTELL